ncbi:MAG TPA: thioredoxin domain-containing protein, partial [Solirubrobacteraceae bacterium]
ALVVVIVASSSNGGGSTHVSNSQKTQAQATVASTLAGIPQHNNVLGNPNAPVTITEYGDLVCPICRDFATTSEPQIIDSLVKTGKAKLVFRGMETASGTANGSQYVNTQVAARSAGLQNKEWDYVLLTYQEQPQTINGTAAEQVSYVNQTYLQNLAKQVKGLNLAQWQGHMTDQTLVNAVNADGQAAQAAGATGTPAIYVKGPKGTVMYNQNNTLSAVPTEQQIQQLVSQQS